MNKRTLAEKKALNALRIITLIIFLSFLSCKSLHVKNSNTEISKFLINKLSEIHKDTLYISDRADNKYISSLYEDNFADSMFYKMENSRQWMAKKASNNTVINDTNIIKEIFTKENYEYIKKQAGTYKWSKNEVSQFSGLYPVILLKDDKNRFYLKPDLQISKPVYTVNNKYALVSYTYKGATALVVFENQDGNWEQVKYIPLHNA